MNQVESGRQLEIFLCHSSGDRDAVRALQGRLQAEGYASWLDQDRILPGQNWDQEIRHAIRQCQAVVICLSPASVSKEGYVQKEIRLILDVASEKPPGTIFVIPARLNPCSIPDGLRSWQWVDLFEAGGYEKLVAGLRQRQAQWLGMSPASGETQASHDALPGTPVTPGAHSRAQTVSVQQNVSGTGNAVTGTGDITIHYGNRKE